MSDHVGVRVCVGVCRPVQVCVCVSDRVGVYVGVFRRVQVCVFRCVCRCIHACVSTNVNLKELDTFFPMVP